MMKEDVEMDCEVQLLEETDNLKGVSVSLNLEDNLKKRKAGVLQRAKPVFLTRAQRAEILLERKPEQRSLNEESGMLRLSLPNEGKELTHFGRQQELERLKEQYLGSKKLNRRVVKPSEKFRLSFNEENHGDTSRDMNPLYQNPHEAQLLFGRGFRAGIDKREQKLLRAKRQSQRGRENQLRDEKPDETVAQKQNVEAATGYDTFDMQFERHWSEKKVEEMTKRDWRIFQEDYDISYKGLSFSARPMRNWEEAGLSRELLEAVKKVGYRKPSPIQMAAIPLGLEQRDVIGIAGTGSGKTAAFVLPMLTYISKLPIIAGANEAEGPYAVVMAPTRELAQQINNEIIKLAHFLNIRVVLVVGGQCIQEQGIKLGQGFEILVATPGRLLDCLERRYLVLNQCNYVVLDEADRMIDMGFEEQVTRVLDAMSSSHFKSGNEEIELHSQKLYRTLYMFSATMPPAVERLARKYLRNPVMVTIGTADKAPDLIAQHVMMINETEKFNRLRHILNGIRDKAAIIFVNTRENADTLSKRLAMNCFQVTSLHGGNKQEHRDASLEEFKSKRVNCLVATDVVGRGIDIRNVAHVINYDMPTSIEMYTHRIGRTGRAGKTGVATTFLTLNDADVFYDLKQMLVQSKAHVPLELARHQASKCKLGTIPNWRL